MLRRTILTSAAAWFCISNLPSGIGLALAEFSVGIGNLSKYTEPASFRLHDGLADFNKMMGALDVNNVAGARIFRDFAVKRDAGCRKKL